MLDNINRKNPFRVPENYFEDFHKEMMSHIKEEPKSKTIPLWRKVAPWTAIAAVLGGVIISISVLSDKQNEQIADNILDTNNTTSIAYAPAIEDDDFYLFLEDEVARDSYYSTINF